jgi:hypothetical protein
MSKAIEGAAMLGGAAAIGAGMIFATGGLGAALNAPFMIHAMEALALGGLSMEAGAIASALTSNRGMGITTRQPAAFRQFIVGEQRVGGVIVYQSTTGSKHDQYNFVIAFAGHEIENYVNLYLDGRQVFWDNGAYVNVRNGVYFGGNADGNNHTGPDGQQYNFGGKVFCSPYFGDQTFGPDSSGGVAIPGGGFSTSLYANDPTWGPGAGGTLPCLMGCAYIYLKIEYDTTLFPSLPEIKVTVRGKNDIFDPRTGTRGYSTNWALLVADQITDTTWGLGDTDGVNQDQLIAAANVCDEAVDVAATGTTEARYSCHFHDDSSVDPFNRLQKMMNAAVGRVSRIGGEWYIWPAYWQGPSFTFDSGALIGSLLWEPYRSLKDLCNRVAGTYIAPNYPYNTAGNLYDGNGFYDGHTANYFPFAFQPTNYPQYAQDPQHGYAADEFLLEDSGVLGTWDSGTTYETGDAVTYTPAGTSTAVIYRSLADANVGNEPDTSSAWIPYQNLLPMEFSQQCCLSVTQAQRCAKIYLLRNRFQGSGTLPMTLAAMVMQPIDVLQMTFPEMGWTEKTLEIAGDRFTFDQGDGTRGPSVRFDGVGVRETDPSIYEWDPSTEELTPYDVPAVPQQQSRVPAAPTGMSLTANPLIGLDNIVHTRVEVQWTTPADVLTTQIVIRRQLQPPGMTVGPWITAGFASVSVNAFFDPDVIAGQTYGYQIASVRPGGAQSPYAEIDGFTVGVTLSLLTNLGVGIGSLIGQALTGGGQIVCNPFVAAVGQLAVSVLPAGSVTLTASNTGGTSAALTAGQIYAVYYIDPAFAGGAVTPIATQNPADYLNKVGYFLIDSVAIPTSAGGAGYRPSAWTDLGTQTTRNPASAYDTSAVTHASIGASDDGTDAFSADCLFEGFPSLVTASALTLTVVAAVTGHVDSATVTATIAGTSTTMLSTVSATAQTAYTLAVPSGTDLSTVTIEGVATAITPTSGAVLNIAALEIFDINIQ